MGRNKIKIEKIENDRKRATTFQKRRHGLIKKAMELSILCECEISLMIFLDQKLVVYSSSDIKKMLLDFVEFKDQFVSFTNDDYTNLAENQIDIEQSDRPLTESTQITQPPPPPPRDNLQPRVEDTTHYREDNNPPPPHPPPNVKIQPNSEPPQPNINDNFMYNEPVYQNEHYTSDWQYQQSFYNQQPVKREIHPTETSDLPPTKGLSNPTPP
ncbi:uncharacterized protein QTN25_009100 [Entamoeba marina]